jgi:hypothetical protein
MTPVPPLRVWVTAWLRQQRWQGCLPSCQVWTHTGQRRQNAGSGLRQRVDWLGGRQDAIETGLARRHLGPEPNPSRMALFDLSSSWMEGSRCPLAARGYSRDGKKGTLQIEYGLLTDPAGRPVAIRVFPGNTGDPGAFTAIVDVVREKFGLEQM